MPIAVERIRADIEAIARCTQTPGKGATRPTFSDAWSHARSYVIGQAKQAGCDIRNDIAGNIHARPTSLGWDLPAWLCGSHIDTVPHGGDYDGVAGVVVALELLRSAHAEGMTVPVELIVFAEEEGTTFGLGMIGSRAWVGDLAEHQLRGFCNAAGQSYFDACGAARKRSEGVEVLGSLAEMRLVGKDQAHRLQASLNESKRSDRIRASRYQGLIEVHIEQGPGMWQRNERLAIVRAIAGRRQMLVKVRGQANHAGATSMLDRRDALAGAAECITALEAFARQSGAGAVLTVGRIENHPNAINVIPERIEFTVDFRSGDATALDQADGRVRGVIEDICRRRGLQSELRTTESIAAQPMDPALVQRLGRAAGAELPITVSGALHDSAILAPHIPTAMLFVPSRDGISHNPAEFSRVEDIAAAASVVERLVRRPTLAQLNAMDQSAFVATCGPVFEHSPWIAERAWGRPPFASFSGLHERLCSVVASATPDEHLSLIRAHPDLVGRLAREGKLTRESTTEQAAAGLTSLSDDEIHTFERLNAQYRDKFGFPFIICARENKKDAILAAFPRRLANTREQEIAAALAEIYKIARLRLSDAIWED
jgi:OHCU decarboxylase